MTGRFAVDFGTSNTLVTQWDEMKGEATPISIPEYSRNFIQGGLEVSVIPSIIHYAEQNRQWIGQQVMSRGLYQSPRTFRWMKRFITNRSPIHIKIDGVKITPYEAGRDFLRNVLLFSVPASSLADEEVAFSVPVEAFEHYETWLYSVAESAGLKRFRLIDEPSAAALGYGAHIQPGDVYMVFDFGGGTMHASVIRIEPESGASSGRRCRVLGKAGRDIGGTTIDQWIYQDVLHLNHLRESESLTRRLSTELLVNCERIKESLSADDSRSLSIVDPESGAQINYELTAQGFSTLLDNHELFLEIEKVFRSALAASREKGFDETSVKAVFMVGGSSQIPAVQQHIKRMFGKDRVSCNRPLEAVARGAAAFISGVEFFDYIQHDYAIRYINSTNHVYEYRTLVERGTPYPSDKPIARLTIKASYSQQTHLGVAIFELGNSSTVQKQTTELVFDPSGAARLIEITPDETEQRSLFWMNENTPTFLVANPPAEHGEPCFEVSFSIDVNKRLLISARDLRTGNIVLNQHPVIKLT